MHAGSVDADGFGRRLAGVASSPSLLTAQCCVPSGSFRLEKCSFTAAAVLTQRMDWNDASGQTSSWKNNSRQIIDGRHVTPTRE